MHELLSLLHPLTEFLRFLPGVVYHYGPGVLGKYTMVCAWLICGLCVVTGLYDFRRGRRLDVLLWVAMAATLFGAFWMETRLATERSRNLAWAALAIALVLLLKSVGMALVTRQEPARRYP